MSTEILIEANERVVELRGRVPDGSLAFSQELILLYMARGVVERKELAARMGMTRQAICIFVKELVDRDLVKSGISGGDLRSRPLSLTRKGEEHVARVERALSAQGDAA